MQPKTTKAAVGYGSVPLGTKEQTKRFFTPKKKMPLAWALIPTFAALILFFIVFKTNDTSKSWEDHKEEFSLVFPKETDGLHKQCYEENLKKIAALNAKQDATFEAGEFAHLCGSHFLHCGARKREGAKMENGLGAQEESDFKIEWFDPEKHFFANERLNEFGELSSSDIPDEFDWTDYVNPPIKDQGNYGSCWTMAAAEGIEMARWIEGKGYERVSAQQLLDCLNVIQTPGKQEFCFRGHCGYLGSSSTMNGGWAEDAYRYWHYEGYVKAKDYPYQWSICKQRELLNNKLERTIENVKANCLASDYCAWNDTEWQNANPENFFYHLAPQYCQNIHPIQTSCREEEKEDWGKTKGVVLVSWNSTYFNSPGINEELMKEALYRMGPLTVDMNAVPYLHYKSGILDYSEEECSPNDLDHVLQLVGYGTENGVDYWKIRNSWSPWFGENGYVRFKRGKNICGIAESVSRPMI